MRSPDDPSLYNSACIQGRVIWALLMREIITRYGRHNIGFLWMFVAPMLLISIFVSLAAYNKTTSSSGGFSLVGFAVTGYCAAFLWRNMPGRCINAVEPNLTLMYHRNVKVFDIYVSRIILEAAGESMAFILLSFTFIFLGWMEGPDDILKVLGGWWLLAWFGAAFAITLGSLSEMFKFIEKIWGPFSLLMLSLSGAFFMVDWMPESTQQFLLYLPMIHGTELLREGYFGSAIRAHYDLSYMITCCLCLTLLGLVLIKAAARRATLG